MAYDQQLADKVREYLSQIPELKVDEKKMFGGLAFMVQDKMCINVSDDKLMCRFDPAKTQELAEKPGFLPMTMRGKKYQGYCYVEPTGLKSKKDFEFWIDLCLNFNAQAKPSKQRQRS